MKRESDEVTIILPMLDYFGLGNEINMEAPKYRPANYTFQSYVNGWNYKTEAIQAAVEKVCLGAVLGFMSPSFLILDIIKSNWSAEALFQLGYDPKNPSDKRSVIP